MEVTILESATQEAVTQGIKDSIGVYLQTIAFNQDFVSYAQIGVAILNTEGVRDFENLTVNGETSNLAVGERECAILGEAVISYA